MARETVGAMVRAGLRPLPSPALLALQPVISIARWPNSINVGQRRLLRVVLRLRPPRRSPVRQGSDPPRGMAVPPRRSTAAGNPLVSVVVVGEMVGGRKAVRRTDRRLARARAVEQWRPTVSDRAEISGGKAGPPGHAGTLRMRIGGPFERLAPFLSRSASLLARAPRFRTPAHVRAPAFSGT